ncbi:MAG: hypothetical protein OXH53_07075 [bacterium]|nr:hypothetical protein [bacterium]
MAYNPKNRQEEIPIATPAELAAALRAGGYAVRETHGRTFDLHTSTAICHGGDSDHKLGLAFDADRRHWNGHCLTGTCTQTAILHRVQEASGLAVCRCDACFQNWREGATAAPGGHFARKPTPTPQSNANKGAESRSKPKSGRKHGADMRDYAAQLWAAARPSTEGPGRDHPAGQWLRRRRLWPGGVPLPDNVRWLTRQRLPGGPATRPLSTAAGALALAMRPLSDPLAPVHKLQLIAIDANGGKAQHWHNGDKRTYGADPSAVGLLIHWPVVADLTGCDLHVCEGLADGLAVLAGLPFEERRGSAARAFAYARAGQIAVAVLAGKSYQGIDPAPWATITLWPDADDADALPAARAQAQQWADQGHLIEIARLPTGYDPAGFAQELRETQND